MDLAVRQQATRILIVDDDEKVRRLLARILTREGFTCDLAADAAQALEDIEDREYDLVITDVNMPGMSGMELLAEVLGRRPDTSVILVTGLNNTSTAVTALEHGAYDYILKPFEATEVIISVRNALRRRQLEIENRSYREHLEERVRDQTEEIRSSHKEIALRLVVASEYRDNETGAHVRRIGQFCEAVCDRMGMPAETRDRMGLAAAMHDVGKVGIPDAILRKPARLEPWEFEVMKSHTVIGGQILSGRAIPLLVTAREVALGHHERWDGKGYPNGVHGKGIPLPARIVAVIDVWDALIHERVYKAAWPEETALEEIRKNRGTQFDGDVVDVFLGLASRLHEINAANPDPKLEPRGRGE
jgi:putative two-component system response regulator